MKCKTEKWKTICDNRVVLICIVVFPLWCAMFCCVCFVSVFFFFAFFRISLTSRADRSARCFLYTELFAFNILTYCFKSSPRKYISPTFCCNRLFFRFIVVSISRIAFVISSSCSAAVSLIRLTVAACWRNGIKLSVSRSLIRFSDILFISLFILSIWNVNVYNICAQRGSVVYMDYYFQPLYIHTNIPT